MTRVFTDMSEIRFRFHSSLMMSIDPETALHTQLRRSRSGLANSRIFQRSGLTRRRGQLSAVFCDVEAERRQMRPAEVGGSEK